MGRYVKLRELKHYLGVVDDSEDPALEQALRAAESYFDSNFDMPFVAIPATYNIPWDGRRGPVDLPGPLQDLKYVELGGVRLLPEQYYVPPAPVHWLAILDQGLRPGVLTVAGDWGHTKTPPDIVKHAVLRLAAYYYRQRDSQDAMAGNQDVGALSLGAELPGDVISTIRLLQDRYMLWTPS